MSLFKKAASHSQSQLHILRLYRGLIRCAKDKDPSILKAVRGRLLGRFPDVHLSIYLPIACGYNRSGRSSSSRIKIMSPQCPTNSSLALHT